MLLVVLNYVDSYILKVNFAWISVNLYFPYLQEQTDILDLIAKKNVNKIRVLFYYRNVWDYLTGIVPLRFFKESLRINISHESHQILIFDNYSENLKKIML